MKPLAQAARIDERTPTRRFADQPQRGPVSCDGGIREALQEGRFAVYAQPIVELQSGETVHHELLIRLCTADGRIVSSDLFLPVAEELSLLRRIDRWMLGHTALLAGCGIPVAVNLSAQSLAQPWLIGEFRAELSRAGADPSLIIVALTETALHANGRSAQGFARGLRSLGGRIALLGFDPGRGDLSSATGLPVDLLALGCELLQRKAGRRFVREVVDLARESGRRTVAEGVEDEPTLRMLRELGVDYAQGHEIAEPGPIHEIVAGT